MIQLFNRYFFYVASLLNGGGDIIAYESNIAINLEESSISIDYIDLQHMETMEGTTKWFVNRLKENKVTDNAALDLSDIKTTIAQRKKHSVINIQAKMNDSTLILDRLGFFYQNEKLVYKSSPNETITQSNGVSKGDFIEFSENEIIMNLSRKDDPTQVEDWIQMFGKPEPLNDILEW